MLAFGFHFGHCILKNSVEGDMRHSRSQIYAAFAVRAVSPVGDVESDKEDPRHWFRLSHDRLILLTFYRRWIVLFGIALSHWVVIGAFYLKLMLNAGSVPRRSVVSGVAAPFSKKF
jgi:hypothetical protein